MRHNKSGRKLNRSSSHRKAMFRNMAKALVTYERIRTTEPRAKELSKVVDRLVTLALKNDLPARRQAYKVLGNHGLVKRLFDDIGPRFVGVKGGFTRVVKLGRPRAGDAAPMAIIELTARAADEAPAEEAKPKKKSAAKKTAPKKAAAKEATKDEAPAEAAGSEDKPKKKAPAKKAAPKKTAKKDDEATDETPKKKAPAKKAAPKKAAAKKDDAPAKEEAAKDEPEADKE